MADDPLIAALRDAGVGRGSHDPYLGALLDQARTAITSARHQTQLAQTITRTAIEAIARVRALCDTQDHITATAIRAALDGSTGPEPADPTTADRISFDPPEAGGGLDEVVVRGCTVHLERLNTGLWMLICDAGPDRFVHVNLHSPDCEDIPVTATVLEHGGIPEQRDGGTP